LLEELRRILRPEGSLSLTIWPLYQGAAGGLLRGGLRTPFSHLLFQERRLADGVAEPVPYDVEQLDILVSQAGLAVYERWLPEVEHNPCSLEFQSRFGAALVRLGRTAAELRYAYAIVAKPVSGECSP
jgi:hypothetical protein